MIAIGHREGVSIWDVTRAAIPRAYSLNGWFEPLALT